MTRGQRVRVRYADVWPQCVCWPNGKVGTVLEVVGAISVLEIDGFKNTANVNITFLEVIPDETRN